jgi:hypothetical protein
LMDMFGFVVWRVDSDPEQLGAFGGPGKKI